MDDEEEDWVSLAPHPARCKRSPGCTGARPPPWELSRGGLRPPHPNQARRAPARARRTSPPWTGWRPRRWAGREGPAPP